MAMDRMVDQQTTMAFTACSSGPRRPCGHPCRKGTNMIIAIILVAVASRQYAKTGGQRKMRGKLFGYASTSVADTSNLENQRRVLAERKQVFYDMGSWASWNRPGLNRLGAAI